MSASSFSLSIVVPIYNESENLRELASRLNRVAGETNATSVEVILISDGSTDESEEIIADIVAQNRMFKGVFLTRNFGHQAAVSKGIEMSEGSVVTVIDGDLQDPPEAILTLLDEILAGSDVAYGVRTKRKEHFVKRFAYSSFYRLLRRVAAVDMPLDSGDFCCMRRPVVDAMLQLPERRRFVRGLRAWVGFRQVGVPYERGPRYAGVPKYTFRRLMALAYDGIFSFTNLPIRMMQFLGLAISLLALVTAVTYVVLYSLGVGHWPDGFASLIVSIWFFGGVQLFFLGIVGEYVTRTFDEARRRPIALVRQILEHDPMRTATSTKRNSVAAQDVPAKLRR